MTCRNNEILIENLPGKHWSDPLMGLLLRIAAGGAVPGGWFQQPVPPRQGYRGRLELEIVSHCWKYSHLLAYQLSSLILFPPRKLQVTMTVYYCPEDKPTRRLLEYFGGLEVDNVVWNWRALPRRQLFRRAIGRHHAARHTAAHWIWFTDCDLMFRKDCLDTLADLLQGREDVLVYPRTENITPLLPDDELKPSPDNAEPEIKDIDEQLFYIKEKNRATGPLQITHGDAARALGYCGGIKLYQTPAETWCKAHEDRAFRWLLRSRGTPVDLPGVYRIRHAAKGRYTGGGLNTGLRSRLRRLTSWVYENLRKR